MLETGDTIETDAEIRRSAAARADLVDEICDRFEAEWQNGRKPVIGDFLPDDIQFRREVFVELLLAELEYTSGAASREDYVSQYPEFAADVESAFADSEAAERTASLQTADTAQLTLSKVGPYQILEPLGEGGMGSVFRAKHTTLHRVVAIKFLPLTLTRNETAVARFQREMATIGQLDHPHLLRASHADTDGRSHYIVTEYLAGLDLGKICRAWGHLDAADACELIRQAALGVQHLHDLNIIHRDIKPSNIMLCSSAPDGLSDPAVKVIDFGLARAESVGGDPLTSSRDLFGTFQFMAPEQFDGNETVDKSADIYALGATLYKLLTGFSPCQTDGKSSLAESMMAITSGEVISADRYRPDLPAGLASIIEAMLSRSPADRIATAADVATALRPFCRLCSLQSVLAVARQQLEVESPVRGRLTPAAANARNRRSKTRMMIAGLLAIVSIGAWQFVREAGLVPSVADSTSESAREQPQQSSSQRRIVDLGKHHGISNIEAAMFDGNLQIFYSDVDLFGMEVTIDNQWRVDNVRQSHFAGRRSFCGQRPKMNPPFFPVYRTDANDEEDLYVFLPTGEVNNRRILTDIHYYRVAQPGTPELKRDYDSEQLFDYYSTSESAAPELTHIGGYLGALKFSPETNHVCVAGGTDAAYLVCTNLTPTVEIFRVPWDSLESTSEVVRTVIHVPSDAGVDRANAIIQWNESPALIWAGNLKRDGGFCETLVTKIPLPFLSGEQRLSADSLSWNRLTEIPCGEIKLAALATSTELLVLERGSSETRLNRTRLDGTNEVNATQTCQLPANTGHIAVVSGAPVDELTIVATLLTDNTFQQVEVISLPPMQTSRQRPADAPDIQ